MNPPSRHTKKRDIRFSSAMLILVFIIATVLVLNINVSAQMTLESIANNLRSHLESVHDVTAQVTFTQFSKRDGSRNDGELKLEAIFPDLIRATWKSPEIYAGVFFILDTMKNTYTEYVPAMGEAHRLPLDQVLEQQSVLQLQPEQLFSLPSAEDYDLKLIGTAPGLPPEYVIVEAVEKARENRTFSIWVNTSSWLITRIEEHDTNGRLLREAEATNIRINQDLSETSLRLLPPGTVERSGR